MQTKNQPRYVKPNIRITGFAYESLIKEVQKRKLESLSELVERLAVELEQNRK